MQSMRERYVSSTCIPCTDSLLRTEVIVPVKKTQMTGTQMVNADLFVLISAPGAGGFVLDRQSIERTRAIASMEGPRSSYGTHGGDGFGGWGRRACVFEMSFIVVNQSIYTFPGGCSTTVPFPRTRVYCAQKQDDQAWGWSSVGWSVLRAVREPFSTSCKSEVF